MNNLKSVKGSSKLATLKKINRNSLTEAQKEIFLKYLKYDIQVASGSIHESLSSLMVIELNRTNATHNKDIWLRLLRSWINSVKSNRDASSTCDNILKEMLNDEFSLMKPSTQQLSCILNHVTTESLDSPNAWNRISAALSSPSETKSGNYWQNVFDVAKIRTALKQQFLQSLQRNNIEIAEDLQMTEIENRILQLDKSTNEDDDEHTRSVDQCRVCLEYGISFLNLFNDSHETPSTIDKLMECSRISQISEGDRFPQSICENCIGHLETAYQFRILSEISEHKLITMVKQQNDVEEDDVSKFKTQITIVDDVNVAVEENSIEECDDNQADNQMDDNEQFEIWEETNENSEILQPDVPLHQCETCGITFDTLKLLKKHKRCHITAPISSRECKLCSKVFKSEALLRAHGRTHSDLRPYICETCGKCFKTTSQLASHCLTHSDVKNFECPNCSYRGNTNNNLRIHLRTHTRVQPYSCRYCQWKFSTASNMQKHIRNIHHKMRTHQCNECEKSFFAKESLRKHMVTHTGIKLYSCSICCASYAWYNGLKKHMRVQHIGEKCPSEITFRPTKSMC